MSVIITGESLPNTCGHCGGCYDYKENKFFCSLSAEAFDIGIKTKRPKKCPLKSIDGLISSIQKEIDRDIGGTDPNGVQMYKIGLQVAINVIKGYCKEEQEE